MSGLWRLREAGVPYKPAFVIDASVAVAGAFDEPWSSAARDLFAQAERDELSLIVPDLFWYEVAHALRHGLAADGERLSRTIRWMGAAPVATISLDPADLAGVVAMAVDEGLTVYDAAYLFLARQVGCSLITQDRKLLTAAGGRFSRSLREIGL